jgi:GTP-binding protein Era
MRCGTVGLIGRPNTGKSTLLNRLIGEKLSITSPKPQTTRHRILAVKTLPGAQILYLDAPGIETRGREAIHRYMNRAASGVIAEADVIVLVCAGLSWVQGDEAVLAQLVDVRAPVILAVNKVDLVADKRTLLPHLEALAKRRSFAAIVPVSARNGANLEALEAAVVAQLPAGEAVYPEDTLTDRSERFLAAEVVREKLFRALGEELPYALTVQLERFKEEGNLVRMDAVIWVTKASHKAIVIGAQGARLKAVGTRARADLEQFLGRKVMLTLWVRVKSGWADDERALRRFGYAE